MDIREKTLVQKLSYLTSSRPREAPLMSVHRLWLIFMKNYSHNLSTGAVGYVEVHFHILCDHNPHPDSYLNLIGKVLGDSIVKVFTKTTSCVWLWLLFPSRVDK